MASTPQTPIQIHIPPSLQEYTTPLTEYLATHPQYTNLVVSAFIFDPPSSIKSSDPDQQPRLLVLHRAAHERSFANRWEVPGGSSDASDPTILHSLAREVFEETDLMLTRFVRQIGDVVEFQTGKGERRKNWAKLNFEIEVAEVTFHGVQSKHMAGRESTKVEADGQSAGNKNAEESKAKGKSAAVTIDPQEHQGYAWATAEDITVGKYLIATPAQRELILGAFRAQ